jgi:hypothetical protein
MKRGQFTPRHLVSLRTLRELKGFAKTKKGFGSAPAKPDGGFEPSLDAKHFPALAHAAESFPPGCAIWAPSRQRSRGRSLQHLIKLFWRQAVGST